MHKSYHSLPHYNQLEQGEKTNTAIAKILPEQFAQIIKNAFIGSHNKHSGSKEKKAFKFAKKSLRYQGLFLSLLFQRAQKYRISSKKMFVKEGLVQFF